MSGAALISSRKVLESIGADADITWEPYVSQVTAYGSAITLSDGTRDGQLKKIYNDGTGGAILVDCALPGSDTQIQIDDNQNCTLIWVRNSMVWRLVDATGGVTLQ